MQICPLHNVPLQLLFTSSYCPLCEATITSRFAAENKPIPFEDLSSQEQRIWFAKDVLAQLYKNKLIIDTGAFVEKMSTDTCTVCALGALAISCLTKRTDFTTLDELSSFRESDRLRSVIHDLLSPYFSSDQLDLIEAAFEERADYARVRTPQVEIASKLYSLVDLPEERLICIMQNIIDNQGTFVIK